MAKSVQKITLSSSRDIPFDKLVLSQSNVRHVKAGVSIEELAEDIARRGLLMGLSVRAIVDAAGVETGMFEIPAGGRRYRALALLAKQKRLARNALVPCVVRSPLEQPVTSQTALSFNMVITSLQSGSHARLHGRGRSGRQVGVGRTGHNRRDLECVVERYRTMPEIARVADYPRGARALCARIRSSNAVSTGRACRREG